MVDPAASTAPGSLLGALLARKGEAAPAVAPLQAQRLGGGVRGRGVAGERQQAGKNSPLAFLIARRPGAAPADEGGMRRQPAPVNDQPAIEMAAARRRPLTVRLRQEDFLRLRALTEAQGATYQSLIEAGILGVLSTAGAPSAAAHTPATVRGAVPATDDAARAKRRLFRG